MIENRRVGRRRTETMPADAMHIEYAWDIDTSDT
jgi:hypothetical protein